MIRHIVAFTALASAALLAQGALAQAYPSKPIRLVVPFSAGGPGDIMARWVGARMNTALGRPVVVDNRAGAGGLIGAQAVATAPADGYTLLFSSVGAIAIAPYISDNVPYDPQKDLAPVVRFATAPSVLVTAAASKFGKLSDLVSYARANPGKVTYASAGVGTTTHLAVELLKREARIDMVHVPYRGAAPALTDVMGGSADVTFLNLPVVLPYLKSGKLKALTIDTPARIAALPDVPTTGEAGYKSVLSSTWYGILAPARTPRDVVMKINAAVNTMLVSSEGKAFIEQQGLQANGGAPEQFGSFIQSEAARWTALAKAIGVKLE